MLGMWRKYKIQIILRTILQKSQFKFVQATRLIYMLFEQQTLGDRISHLWVESIKEKKLNRYKKIGIITRERSRVQENGSRRVSPAETAIVRDFKTKRNERGEGNRMKIWKEYT